MKQAINQQKLTAHLYLCRSEHMIFSKYFHDSSRTLEKLTADLTDEQAGLFINDRVNNIKWQIGHIILTRIYLLESWNSDRQREKFLTESERMLFDRGGRPPRDPEVYPALERLMEAFRLVDKAWQYSLDNFSDEELQRAHSSSGAETLQDLLVFLLTHEAYHCGQIGLVRAGFGYPGVFG